ncbi:hypothetical protein GOV05_00510 [Candidatus Woesearchaeota archaeon]|nr:hypothetical protein [Candidatus Woesearchaeota archaeon]
MSDALIFDTGPIISLANNNLLFVLSNLKESFGGDFFITDAVKKEIIDKPLSSKKWKFEAFQIKKLVREGILKIYDGPKTHDLTTELLNLANKIYSAHNNPIQIVHYAEMQVLAASLITSSDKVVVDERTTRMLVENPNKVKERLERKLHTKIFIDKKALSNLEDKIRGVKVIRSTELIVAAYELGLLDDYLAEDMQNSNTELLDALLWALKLNGCSISEREISAIKKVEVRKT